MKIDVNQTLKNLDGTNMREMRPIQNKLPELKESEENVVPLNAPAQMTEEPCDVKLKDVLLFVLTGKQSAKALTQEDKVYYYNLASEIYAANAENPQVDLTEKDTRHLKDLIHEAYPQVLIGGQIIKLLSVVH